ncbi:MAG: hypothetical protein DI570_16390 [Phenylobacterium zucineum]|nr:MAG: hypothetical protein DI570_16390 [Phenylobacterium zucineum]
MGRMNLKVLAPAAGLMLAAGAARAQEGGYTLVPPAERLTFGDVFADASLMVQAVFAALIVSAVAAVAIWAMSLGKVGKADAKGLAAALGRLKIVRAAGTPLGALTAAYVLLSGFIGIANVRPTPSMAVMAPGWAEAALAVMLGLLATTVGVLCERHLEAQIRRAAA